MLDYRCSRWKGYSNCCSWPASGRSGRWGWYIWTGWQLADSCWPGSRRGTGASRGWRWWPRWPASPRPSSSCWGSACPGWRCCGSGGQGLLTTRASRPLWHRSSWWPAGGSGTGGSHSDSCTQSRGCSWWGQRTRSRTESPVHPR